MTEHEEWPALPYADWAPTKKTLQMCTQMLGKTRLALAPALPEWLHACLYLDGRGFTTGAMPVGSRVATARLDIFEPTIEIAVSDGNVRRVALGGDRCVAEIWGEYTDALAALGIATDIWDKPQEVADTTSFSANTHDCFLVAEHAQRFHRVLSSANAVFEQFRSQFFGRSGVQFWWGAFDLAVLLFNGKHAVAPEDRGYIMRYDLDAEHLNAGFWPGDDSSPTPGFYGYIVPQPPGCETAPISPQQAGWVETMGEWLLPYDEVRKSDDPSGAVRDFLESVYRAAVTLAGWDEEQFAYARPPEPVGTRE